MANDKEHPVESAIVGPEPTTEPTQQEYSLLKKLSEYVPWREGDPRTTDCPLIPFRLTDDGKHEAVDDEYEDRSVPYYLRGRGDEFNFLARRLVQKPSSVTLVTGPPGTGKSALLATVAEYARRLGHLVVELEPRDLASAATIAQKCRNAAMSTWDAHGHRTEQRSVAGGIDLTAAADKIFARLGINLQFAVQKQEQREDIGNVDLIEHLRAVCQYKGKNQRLLIYVDEAQKIADTAASSPDHRDAVGNNLYILNDRLLEGKENLPVTTILAGLTPARQIVRDFISRPASGCDLELTPIATPYIRQVIGDYLNIDEPCRIRPTFFPEELLQRWSEECQGHVLLANQLGYRLQLHAMNHIEGGHPFDVDRNGNETIPLPPNFNETIRQHYYVQQLPEDMHGPVADIVHHLVQASIRNRDPDRPEPLHIQPNNITHPITWEAAIALSRQALNSYPEEEIDEPQPTTPQALQQLQRKGIIRRMRPTPHFLRLHHGGPISPREHCAIPIPTITEYMTEQYAELEKMNQDRIHDNVQQIMQRFPPHIGTQWQWNNVTHRKPIPTIKKVEYEATPSVVPLPLKTASTLHFGSYTFQAITPHYDQWSLIDTDAHPETITIITYPQLLETIKRLEKQLNTTFQWPAAPKTGSPIADNDSANGNSKNPGPNTG